MWGYLPGALPQRAPILSPVVVRLPHGENAWKDVCGGGCGFAMAISDSGKLITWGSTDDLGQSYVISGKHGEMPEPFPLPTEAIIAKVAAGWAHCVSVTVQAGEDEYSDYCSHSDQDFSLPSKSVEVLPSISHLLQNKFMVTENLVNVIVDCAAVPSLVKHLQAPPPIRGGDTDLIPYEHEVEKASAFTLGLLAVKPEHQNFIADAGALPHIVDLLKRHKDSVNSRVVNGVIRRAADAITNLAHENSSIKIRVRVEGGIPPLVELLGFSDPKVQKAAAGALRTLAFKNEENKNQVDKV